MVNQRLIRVLCETCRQAYEPPGRPAARNWVSRPAAWRSSSANTSLPLPVRNDAKGNRRSVPIAAESGYKGRTALFEYIQISDEMREALLRQPRLEVLRQLSRKAGNRTLQEEGVLLVARGVTAINELQRVLKQ